MQEISCKLSHRSCHIFSRRATHEFLHMLNWACIPENNVFTFPLPNKNIQASIYIFLSERISWNHQTNFRFLTESIRTFYNFINLLKIWLESSWLHLPNNNITNRYKHVDNMIDKKVGFISTCLKKYKKPSLSHNIPARTLVFFWPPHHGKVLLYCQ